MICASIYHRNATAELAEETIIAILSERILTKELVINSTFIAYNHPSTTNVPHLPSAVLPIAIVVGNFRTAVITRA